MLFKSKSQKACEKALNEIQMNLENNYKDLAIGAFKDAAIFIEQEYKSANISEKDYQKYKSSLAVFEKRMEGYSHRLNIKFD